jgi:phage repressor protein C with HTH and peptisase S24 domain
VKAQQPIAQKIKASGELSFRSSFAERLKLAAQAHDIAELAKKIEVTPATLYRWLNAKFDPSLPKLAQLAEAMQVSLAWLVTGTGPMDRRQALRQAQLEGYAAPAFEPASSDDEKPPIAFYEPWLFKLLYGTPEDLTLFAATDMSLPLLIEVRDDSMEPTIRRGDLLLIDRSFGMRPATLKRARRERRSPHDGIYAFRSHLLQGNGEKSTGDLVVRRVQFRLDGAMIIRCDNSSYPEEDYPPKAPHRPVPLGLVIWRGSSL